MHSMVPSIAPLSSIFCATSFRRGSLEKEKARSIGETERAGSKATSESGAGREDLRNKREGNRRNQRRGRALCRSFFRHFLTEVLSEIFSVTVVLAIRFISIARGGRRVRGNQIVGATSAESCDFSN